jgi:acylphosphatase
MPDEDEKRARAHVLVSGRVQGVWFRGTTCEEARALGLTGWVRNRRDGRVEAVFEGEERSVRRIVAWCHKGPPSARVESVEMDWQEPTGEFDRFTVTY